MLMATQLNKKTTKTKKTKEVVEELPQVVVKYFGEPNTSTVVQCEPFLAPAEYIEVKNPLAPSRYHVLDNAGDWVLPSTITYDQLRAEAYLKAWPTEKQLEAFRDNANGDSTKLDQMNKDFEKIKKLYPKE